MRHKARTLTLFMKVTALITVLTWATTSHDLARASLIVLTLAVAIVGVARRPRLPRSAIAQIASVGLGLGLAIVVFRAWMFPAAVLLIWAALAAVATVVWLCTRPAVRSAVVALVRPGYAQKRADAV